MGHVDLAATFCEIADIAIPDWNQGAPLPTESGSGRERVLTEWDCEHRGTSTFIRSIYRDGLLCSAYEPSSLYDGSEGELYDLGNDPNQFENLWDDPTRKTLRSELIADLYEHLPASRPERLRWRAPV